jgi:GT2 family glycosyltransferase
MKNLCDIVVLSLNNYRLTKACLESVLSCDAGFPFALHLFDNASSDGTPDSAARDFGGRVRVWRSGRNLGFAGGNNAVLSRTRGRFACLLNNDTVAAPGWLGEMVAAAEQDPRVGVVGCRGNNANLSERPEQAVDFDATPETMDVAELRRAAAALSLAQPRFRAMNLVVGYCMLLRRTMLDRVGLLDARFWPGGFEDEDICRRAVEAGYKVAIANRSLVYHYISCTLREERWRGVFEANREIFRRKWVDTGRIDAIRARPRRQLRIAAEAPQDEATAQKLLAVCEELAARGAKVHMFCLPGRPPPPDCGVPRVASAAAEKRYADSDIVIHCARPPHPPAQDRRLHVQLVTGEDEYNPPDGCYRLALGRANDRRFAPKSVSVKWTDATKQGRGSPERAPETFYDMVDGIEEHFLGLLAACGTH